MMEALSTTINGLLQLSPPVILGVCLWVLGFMIRKSPYSNNWTIPFVCAFLGTVIYPFVAEIGQMSHNVRVPWMLNGLFGFGIGAAPVVIDQMQTQWGNFKADKAKDDDTNFFRRDASKPKPVDPPPDI